MRAFVLLILPALAFGYPITNEHIKAHPLTQIEQELISVYFHEPALIARYENSKPLFKTAILREASKGFFGYHASTHLFRLFQDILHVFYEDYLGFPIPEDFQFMRIPADPLFDLREGTKSYYDLFEPTSIALASRNQLITALILEPFSKENNARLTLDQFSEKELRLFFEIIKKNILSKTWPKGSTLPTFKTLFSWKKKYLDKIEKILSKEDPNYSYKKKKLTDLIENPPPLNGAHSMAPLIKGTLGKKLAKYLSYDALINALFEIADDGRKDSVITLIFPYWDTRPEQQSRVISINFSLFANHMNIGESTLHVFLGNESIEGGENRVRILLESLFEEAGLSKEMVDPLIQEGLERLYTLSQTGEILQFFDASSKFTLVNETAYVSEPFGIPIKEFTPSQIATGAVSPFQEEQPMQLRLLTSNQKTLHPYQGLKVIRYDGIKKEDRALILQFIREQILSKPPSEEKRQIYKKKIESLWL